MKKLLPAFFISMLVIKSNAQTGSLQAGPVISFFGQNEKGYGGELIANIPVQKILTVGAGVQLLKFDFEPNLYVPVFATFQVSVPAKKIVYFFHIDPGYGIHHYHTGYLVKLQEGNFQVDFKNTGGFYLGTGAGFHLKSKASPYLNFQYSLCSLKLVTKSININDPEDPENVVFIDHAHAAGITITAGIWLHAKK